MFITESCETQQLCYKCLYGNKGTDYCQVDLCKGGWQGYFTLETVKDVEEHQGYCKKDIEIVQSLDESPLDIQVGGGHYKNFTIQPVEFCQKNQLNYCEGNIVKYACRHRDKNGVEDVRKIIHYAQLLLQLEYGVNE